MKDKRLLVDMDSVTTDLMSKWHQRYNADYDDDLTVEKVSHWGMHELVKQECGSKIYDYLEEEGFYRDLSPLPHAVETLERLSEDFEIFLVTASPVNAMADKVRWVKTHLPFFDPQKIVFTHHKYIVKGDLLFDDAPHNLLAFQQHGGLAVAMDYPYNRGIDCPRVKNWLEFEKFVRERLG